MSKNGANRPIGQILVYGKESTHEWVGDLPVGEKPQHVPVDSAKEIDRAAVISRIRSFYGLDRLVVRLTSWLGLVPKRYYGRVVVFDESVFPWTDENPSDLLDGIRRGLVNAPLIVALVTSQSDARRAQAIDLGVSILVDPGEDGVRLFTEQVRAHAQRFRDRAFSGRSGIFLKWLFALLVGILIPTCAEVVAGFSLDCIRAGYKTPAEDDDERTRSVREKSKDHR